MTDPESQHEAAPPAPPPRPTSQTRSPASRSQLEQDEIYARQLAEHYQHQEAKRQSARQYRQDQQERYHREREEPERSFLDGMQCSVTVQELAKQFQMIFRKLARTSRKDSSRRRQRSTASLLISRRNLMKTTRTPHPHSRQGVHLNSMADEAMITPHAAAQNGSATMAMPLRSATTSQHFNLMTTIVSSCLMNGT